MRGVVRDLTLTSSSLHLRVATTDDASAIQAIYAPIVLTTAISFEEEPPTVAEMAERIAVIGETYPYLVAERDGQVAGYAYGSQHRARPAYRHAVEVTVYVAEAGRGRGVGRTLYDALLPALTEGGFHMAYAGIALPNPGSIALHEAVGFKRIGVFSEIGFKFGRWHDVGWWQRRL